MKTVEPLKELPYTEEFLGKLEDKRRGKIKQTSRVSSLTHTEMSEIKQAQLLAKVTYSSIKIFVSVPVIQYTVYKFKQQKKYKAC